MVELLEPGPREQVREALSQVQMLYARESRGPGEGPPEPGQGPPPSQGGPGEPPPSQGQDPGREPPPRLWTPPGAS